jgi:2-C-methyl-D-erythritol 2,4-cyclodiphosphate synthase
MRVRAAGLGDIGTHFPDNDPRWAGASSLEFLAQVVELVVQRGYRIANVDATVIAERPKLMPHVRAMREKLATVLRIDLDQVNIKAKTNEGLESVGRGEAMTAQAVATLVIS